MNLKPVNDRIIIERDTLGGEDKQTEGGLFIPASAQDAPQTATVIAVGPGLYETRFDMSNRNGTCERYTDIHTAMPVKAGDRIIIGKYSGANIEHEGRTYTIIGPTDILAIVEG
jgi:chaperonin GroES